MSPDPPCHSVVSTHFPCVSFCCWYTCRSPSPSCCSYSNVSWQIRFHVSSGSSNPVALYSFSHLSLLWLLACPSAECPNSVSLSAHQDWLFLSLEEEIVEKATSSWPFFLPRTVSVMSTMSNSQGGPGTPQVLIYKDEVKDLFATWVANT